MLQVISWKFFLCTSARDTTKEKLNFQLSHCYHPPPRVTPSSRWNKNIYYVTLILRDHSNPSSVKKKSYESHFRKRKIPNERISCELPSSISASKWRHCAIKMCYKIAIKNELAPWDNQVIKHIENIKWVDVRKQLVSLNSKWVCCSFISWTEWKRIS